MALVQSARAATSRLASRCHVRSMRMPAPAATVARRTISSSATPTLGAEETSRKAFVSVGISSLAAGAAGLAFWSLHGTASDGRVAEAEAANAGQVVSPEAAASGAGTKTGPIITRSGKPVEKLRIYIGYDSREDIAYQVARHSILKHATCPVEVIPIKQSDLRKEGLYKRLRDPTESTEFSFTRFLTPYLADYEGWAMFVDCDFLYTADIRELGELLDDRYAVMCVQHDYTPKTATKMDGAIQTKYPRKNWSSMVLYNCSHPKNRVLTPEVVSSQSGAFLHRFMWLDDKDIGNIPCTWNHLVGHNEAPANGMPPKAIHYTLGGPWFDAWVNVEYGDLWSKEAEEYRQTARIQKVIEEDLMKVVESRVGSRLAPIEKRVDEIAEAQREINATQRLLLYHIQDKGLAAALGAKEPQIDA